MTMNTDFKVSFIVPAYNLPAEMLLHCVESICGLSLSRSQREIIVVDDGSDLPAINDLHRVVDDIIYVRQPNGGLSAARNTGLMMATGDYVQFVDGDDFLIRAPYEHCLDIVRYHEAVDMVVFHWSRTTQQLPSPEIWGPMTGVEYMKNNNLRSVVWGYIFKRDILGGLRFNTATIVEDEEFTPQLMLRAKNLYEIPDKAYYYRRRNNSLISTRTEEHIDRRLSDTLNVILQLKHVAQSERLDAREALERRIAQLSMDYLYKSAKAPHGAERLEKAIKALADNGLYPLPDKGYTKKYTAFRKLLSNSAGRKLLVVSSRFIPQ